MCAVIWQCYLYAIYINLYANFLFYTFFIYFSYCICIYFSASTYFISVSGQNISNFPISLSFSLYILKLSNNENYFE